MAQETILDSQLSDEERKRDRTLNFFGFEIRRKRDDKEKLNNTTKIISPILPTEEGDGAQITTAGGYYGQVIDVRGDASKNERDLLVKYRNAAMQTECDAAIEDIVNETIVNDGETVSVSLNLDLVPEDSLDSKTKDILIDEFQKILQLMKFRSTGSEIFRQWYIDGKIVYHKVIDLHHPAHGIKELRRVNPVKIQKIREIEENMDERTGAKLINILDEYYVYSEEGFGNSLSNTYGTDSKTASAGLKMALDTITYCTSGIMDASRRSSLSHLQKALRTVNQLRMMEDSLVIYRLARAPERRIFYIDTGTMSEKKSMEYVEKIMRTYRNKITYDAKTGEVAQDARQQSILEDFWLPRREGGKGTEISTLPGGENLGQIEDIIYFQKKLYRSLNVPVNRLDNETGFNIGRTTEISRDELKFQKFVDRLRLKFSDLFKDILRTQAILKNVMKSDDWENIKEYIIIDFQKDSYFAELKKAEIIKERMDTFESIAPYIGKYFSEEYAMKEVLHMDEDQIKEMRRQIYNEAVRRQSDIKLPTGDDAPTGDGPSGPGGGMSPGGEFAPEGGNPLGGEEGINDVPPPPGGDPEEEDGMGLDSVDETEPTVNPEGGDFPEIGNDTPLDDKDEEEPEDKKP